MSRVVRVRRKLSSEKLGRMKRDAQRTLGLIPAPYRDSHARYEARLRGDSEFLSPPPPGDPIRRYAELALTLIDGKAVEVWVSGVGVSYANLDGPETEWWEE